MDLLPKISIIISFLPLLSDALNPCELKGNTCCVEITDLHQFSASAQPIGSYNISSIKPL